MRAGWHRFSGKDRLLTACHAVAHAPLMPAIAKGGAPLTLTSLIDELLSTRRG